MCLPRTCEDVVCHSSSCNSSYHIPPNDWTNSYREKGCLPRTDASKIWKGDSIIV